MPEIFLILFQLKKCISEVAYSKRLHWLQCKAKQPPVTKEKKHHVEKYDRENTDSDVKGVPCGCLGKNVEAKSSQQTLFHCC